MEQPKRKVNTLYRHAKQQALYDEAIEADGAGDEATRDVLMDQAKKLPMYHGKTLSPEGEAMSTAIYVNEDETLSVSHRPWVERDQPIKKG